MASTFVLGRQCREELKTARRLGELATELRRRAQTQQKVDRGRPATVAVTALFAKGWKGYFAVMLLAEHGYGADAMIVARSLTGLCIDLAYICAEESDERARDWIAVGRWARRKMALGFGRETADEHRTDWRAIGARVKRWIGRGAIKDRAKRGSCLDLYDVAYVHGSSFEHSDAWSSSSYLEWRSNDVLVKTSQSEAHVSNAVFIASFVFLRLCTIWGDFFGIASESTYQKMHESWEGTFARHTSE